MNLSKLCAVAALALGLTVAVGCDDKKDQPTTPTPQQPAPQAGTTQKTPADAVKDTTKGATDAGKAAVDTAKTTATDAGKTATDAGKTAVDAGKTATDTGGAMTSLKETATKLLDQAQAAITAGDATKAKTYMDQLGNMKLPADLQGRYDALKKSYETLKGKATGAGVLPGGGNK